MKKVRSFLKDESGATMVEYGLMVALIAVACVGIVATLGQNLNGQFTSASDSLKGSGT